MNDEQLLTQILNRIAEEDIPDMNKFDTIAQMINQRQMVNRRRMRLMRHIAAVMIIFASMGSLIVYALQQSGDPGLDGVESQGLVQEINTIMIIDDVTVTVERAYADENRIAIWYRVDGLNLPEGKAIGSFFDVRLNTLDGQWFGNGGMSMMPSTDGVSHIVTFEHSEPIPEDGTYDMTFIVDLGNTPVYVIPDDAVLGQGPIPDEYLYTPEQQGIFEFDLELIAHEAQHLSVGDSVESNGVTFTLESLQIAPSETQIVVCYDLPTASDWQPNMMITLDGVEGLLSGYALANFDKASSTGFESPRCIEMSYLLAYTPDSRELVITIQDLVTSAPEPTPEGLELARQRLEEQGIIVQFNLGDHGMGYDLLDYPDDMTQDAAHYAVYDAQRERYTGLWEFIVDLGE